MILSPVAVNPAIRSAVHAGAVIAFSISGGKDSTVAMQGAMDLLDQLGHPRERRVAIHADLGRAEWQSTPATVEAVAGRFGVPLVVARHGKHDMVSRWEARFAEGKRRYANLEIFNLVGPWSSASLRFCTSEMKQQVITRKLRAMFPGQTIISVVGIRREESVARSQAPVSKHEVSQDRRDGTRMLTWHPALHWTTDEVFQRHAVFGLPLHEGYTVYGSSRIGCAFCILQAQKDQRASARAPGNLSLLRHLVGIEADSTFSFQPSRWLGDLEPDLLPATLLADLERRKPLGLERRALEAALPAGLRFQRGWPPRLPTRAEAEVILATRGQILNHHNLEDPYPTPRAVISRFDELLSLQTIKAERLAA